MLNGIEQTTAGLAAVLISIIHDGTERPMAWVSMGLGVVLAFHYNERLNVRR